jgi:hypothetical protein
MGTLQAGNASIAPEFSLVDWRLELGISATFMVAGG